MNILQNFKTGYTIYPKYPNYQIMSQTKDKKISKKDKAKIEEFLQDTDKKEKIRLISIGRSTLFSYWKYSLYNMIYWNDPDYVRKYLDKINNLEESFIKDIKSNEINVMISEVWKLLTGDEKSFNVNQNKINTLRIPLNVLTSNMDLFVTISEEDFKKV